MAARWSEGWLPITVIFVGNLVLGFFGENLKVELCKLLSQHGSRPQAKLGGKLNVNLLFVTSAIRASVVSASGVMAPHLGGDSETFHVWVLK